jgi:hypothetical protein
MVEVPATRDVLQENRPALELPEIRVWIHPKSGGSDSYVTFKTFKEAMQFIRKHPEEAEMFPLLAFRGFEFNLWGVPQDGVLK